MNFKEFISSLDSGELDDYASRCNTTSKYITTHLVPARKTPRKRLLFALALQSGGSVSTAEILDHFGFGSAGAAAAANA